MKIIKDKAIVTDSWTRYSGEGELPDGDIIVSLGVWQERDLSGHNVGLLLEPGDDMGNIRDDLDFFDLIAINFPTFMDGRGYSMAKILRDRYGYTKEIRAVGDVMRDQLFYMQRCGFTSFEIKSGKDINDALKGLKDFSVTYQASSDEPLPLYRRH